MLMHEPQLIAPAASYPITLAELKLQLGFGPMQDSDRSASQVLNDTLRSHIAAATRECESYARRVFITQRWILRMGGFPGKNWRYNWDGYPAIQLPKPPFQSIDFVKYVDTAGAVQDLPLDTSYGNNSPQYGYQLYRGGETEPARIYSSWARPWPPVRMVPSSVMVQFRCGYGCPFTATVAQGSTALTSSMAFNADDGALMVGDTGLPISIPGAGPNGATLNTFVLSVSSGQATLLNAASTAVSNVTAWAGLPVPEEIRNAIKITAQDYYEKRNDGGPLPGAATRNLDYYRNLVA